MRTEILIAGRGGQGILLLGHVLGLAAAKYGGMYATGTESYSAETRGGDSRADIILCTEAGELDYMKVRRASIALFMYVDQLRKYSRLVGDGAKVFVDSTFTSEDDVRRASAGRSWEVRMKPYTDIARRELGTHRVANMVALGHVISVTGVVRPDAVESAIRELVRREWVDLDVNAFKIGLGLEGKG